MADELLPVGQAGNKKRMQDQGDGSYAEIMGLGGLRSSLDGVLADQGAPAVIGSAWAVKVTDGSTIAGVDSAGGLRVNTEGQEATYSAGVIGQVPGTAATDVLTIDGAANKVIRIKRITISGTCTSGGTINVQLVKRSAVDTSGTPTTLTAVPHNSNSPAAVATVKTWASTPPSVGAAVGTVRAGTVVLGIVGTGVATDRLVWDFSTRNGQSVDLISATQTLAVNLNGATILAGNLLDMDIEWTEAAV